jgi:hypothetical protein
MNDPPTIQYNVVDPSGSPAARPTRVQGAAPKQREQDASSKKPVSRKVPVKFEKIPGILEELEFLVEALGLEDPEDVQYRLDALTTSFLGAGLVPKKKLRTLKFHAAIEVLTIPLDNRESLGLQMETFEDLINAYGDEPTDAEMDEAKKILQKVTAAVKVALESVLREHDDKDQLRCSYAYGRTNEDGRN